MSQVVLVAHIKVGNRLSQFHRRGERELYEAEGVFFKSLDILKSVKNDCLFNFMTNAFIYYLIISFKIDD